MAPKSKKSKEELAWEASNALETLQRARTIIEDKALMKRVSAEAKKQKAALDRFEGMFTK